MEDAADGRSFKYRAFVSYAHRDKRAARRIFRGLEAYRVPKDVALDGLPPDRRLGRFFRDDDELGAAERLTDALKDALADSENLVVVCSPHAAASKWVNEEIELFRSLHGASGIWAIVIDGEPGAADPARRCFPPALLAGAEPLAPNLRKEGPLRAVTKLVAGMLGVDFDGLWHRAQKQAMRERRRRLGVRLGLLAVLVGLASAVWYVDSNDIINDAYVLRALVGELAPGGAGAAWKPDPRQRTQIVAGTSAAAGAVRQDLKLELRERDPEVGWTLAQEDLALNGQDKAQDAAAMSLMLARRLPGQSCWPEYVADGACHVLATSWAAAALAAASIPADPKLLNDLLDRQNPDGWWPLYYSVGDNRSEASTYATAWALMALGDQERFADPSLRKRIDAGRAKAAAWLLSVEDRGRRRWKDYPFAANGALMDGVSALAVVALNRSQGDQRIAALDRDWLDHLPVFPGRLDGLERSNVALGRSWKWDRTNYVVTPWLALSGALAYPHGDWLGRAKADAYLARFTEALASYNGASEQSYVSSELVYSFSQLPRPAPAR